MLDKSKIKLALSRRWIAVVSVFALILLSLGSGALISWIQNHPTNQPASNISGLPTNPLSTSEVAVQNLELSGDYSQVHIVAEQAIAKSKDADEKSALYIEEGVTYENQKQYTNAIDAYSHAASLNQVPSIYETIGNAALEAGNKQLAIDSYKKAASLVKNTDARSLSQKQALEDKATELSK